jgi:hypothetical protein
MPVHRGQDKRGAFYQWGTTGKKYYYTTGSSRSRSLAMSKAALQGRAIEWRKHDGRKK